MAKTIQKKSINKKTILPKWVLWVSIILVVIVAAVVYFLANSSHPAQSVVPTAQNGMPPEVDVDRALIMFQQADVFVDVSPTDIWNAHHIANSISIPLDELSSRVNELTRTSVIVVVDRYGETHCQGRDLLLKTGFPNVTCMTGGMNEWVVRGYPFIGTAPY